MSYLSRAVAKISLLCLSLCLVNVAGDKNVKIIIVGSGAAGVAAASRLLENGFENITILEAENRIGGRVFTRKFGDYLVDMGGQWVHGSIDNIVFDMANPLGLLQTGKDYGPFNLHKMYGSGGSGSGLSQKIADKLFFLYDNYSNNIELEGLKTGSVAEFLTNRLKEFFEKNDEIPSSYHQPITDFFNRIQTASDGAYDWNDVSARSLKEYNGSKGDIVVNWKEKGYSTILDILMKKIPDPSKELPVMNNTILNSKVTKIDYENDGPVKVTTADGKEYQADHVIVTCSLGVLKADYKKLFIPSLPEKNINAIQNLGFGGVAKIYLLYDKRWWDEDKSFAKNMIWSVEDKAEFESDPDKSWMLGVSNLITIEHKPKLLCLWMTGEYSKQMEKIPEELFKNQTLGLMNRFFGDFYNVTQPKEILRTSWNNNENFLGTYSYRSLNSDKFNASNADLGEPIIRNNKTIIQFAGEATEPYQYSTVNGAIASGFREADRLIKLHSKS